MNSEDGRKWVFLHGLMGSSANWRKILSGLGGDSFLALDQRGHGRSFQPNTGYRAVDYAEDLYKIVQELGWRTFILVGHSMGGRNALVFADRYPGMVEKLVIEDIGPDPVPGALEYYQNMLGKIPTPFADKAKAKAFFAEEWPLLAQSYQNPFVLGQYLYSNLQEDPEGKMDWRFSKNGILSSVSEGRLDDGWGMLKRLTMPTLLIRGENSIELPRDIYVTMLTSNHRVRGVEISNAGHWVHADQSQEFLRNILEFAKS